MQGMIKEFNMSAESLEILFDMCIFYLFISNLINVGCKKVKLKKLLNIAL